MRRIAVLILALTAFPVLAQETPKPSPEPDTKEIIFAGEQPLTPVSELNPPKHIEKKPCGKYFYSLVRKNWRGVYYGYVFKGAKLDSLPPLNAVWVFLDEAKDHPTAEHAGTEDSFPIVIIRISKKEYEMASCLPPPKEMQEISGEVATD